MVVRELITMLGFKTDKTSLKQTQQAAGGVMKMAKLAVGAFAGMAAVKWVRGAVDEVQQLGEQIGSLSGKTGIGVKELQGLVYAAKQAGIDMANFGMSMRFLAMSQAAAAKGSKEAASIYKTLGVTVKDGEGNFRKTMDVIMDVADGFAGLTSDTERTVVAQRLFGRAGASMIPMMKQGSKGLRDMMLEAGDLGFVMGEDLVAASRKLTKDQKKLSTVMTGIKISVAQGIIPVLLDATEKFIAWWKVNKDLVKVNLARVFGLIASTLSGLVSVIVWAVDVGTQFLQLFSPTGQLVIGALAGLAAIKMGIISGPMAGLLLLGAALAMGLQDWEDYKKGGQSTIRDLAWALDEMFVEGTPFQDALEGWRIFWWDMEHGNERVNNLKQSFLDVFQAIGDGVLEVLETIFAPAIELYKVFQKIGEALGISGAKAREESWRPTMSAAERRALGPNTRRRIKKEYAASQAAAEFEMRYNLGAENPFDVLTTPRAGGVSGFGPRSTSLQQDNRQTISITVPPGTPQELIREQILPLIRTEFDKQNKQVMDGLKPLSPDWLSGGAG